MSEKASNLYVPDYQAWEKFFEKRAKKDQSVGFGFETEKEAIKHQQQDIVFNVDRSRNCQKDQPEPKIISVVSPTEQTVQQAESVMKKAGVRVKNKCSSKKKTKHNPSKKSKTQKKKQAKSSKTFSYRTLADIFSKPK